MNPNMIKNMNEKSNQRVNEKNWPELKAKIKAKWSKMSDSDIEGFRTDLSLISEKIQKTYGFTKENADRQFKEFEASIQSLDHSNGDQGRDQGRDRPDYSKARPGVNSGGATKDASRSTSGAV